MSTNPYARLRRLTPAAPLLSGTVTAEVAGTFTIELPGGSTVQARGVASVGDTVFVRAGLIESQAPAVTLTVIEV